MSALLPPVPLATMALFLGLLGGVAGTKASPQAEAGASAGTARAEAAIVPTDDEDPTAAPLGSIRRAPDGLFYVWAKVNGRPIRFLVDTGASIVVLRSSDAAAVGVHPDADDYRGRMDTASGATSMAWTHLDEVRLGDRRINRLRAAVVRDGLRVSLLGANMLSRLGSVTMAGDRMELR